MPHIPPVDASRTDADPPDAAETTGLDSEESARILALLSANDGSMPQQALVSELDVSKATVSRRLTELEEADRITRLLFRGRKLVWLADRVPAALEPGASTQASVETGR